MGSDQENAVFYSVFHPAYVLKNKGNKVAEVRVGGRLFRPNESLVVHEGHEISGCDSITQLVDQLGIASGMIFTQDQPP